MAAEQNHHKCTFITDGGEMGELTRNKDWSHSSLGYPEQWPQSLRTALNIILNSKFPMFIWWGTELNCFYNDAYRKSLGEEGKHPKILGMPCCEAWPEIWGTIKPIIDTILAGEGATWSEDQLIPILRNGKMEDVYWTFSYSPLFNDTPLVAGVLVTCIETTEKIFNLKKLHESEERFRMMADNIPNLAWIAHADGNIHWYNKKWYQYTGSTPAEMEGWGWQSVHDPEKLPEVMARWTNAIAEGSVFEMTFPLRGCNGEYRQFLTRVLPVKDEEGNITQWFGTNTDVSQQLAVENAVRRSEGRFREMIAQAPVAICVLRGKDFVVEAANKRMLQIWGKTEEELMGKPIFKGMPDAAGQGFEKLLESVYSTGKPFIGNELLLSVVRNGNSEDVFINFVYEPLYDNKNCIDGVMAVATEVTEQVLAKQKLKEGADRVKMVLESLPQMAWTTLPGGEVNFFSDNWYQYTGQSRDEATGYGWTKAIHPDYADSLLGAWQTALASGTPVEQEFKLLNARGEGRWMWVKGTPMKNEQGEVLLWVGTVTDIHERKMFATELEKQVSERTAELESKNLELGRMNKELESFSYIAGHDLQEPLRKIRVFSDQILNSESANLSEGGLERFVRMQKAAQRMQALIDDLLAYSRTASTDKIPERTDLNILAAEVKEGFREELAAKNATLEISPMCTLNVIPFQFRQLLQNLVSNSVKFTPPDRTPVVTIKSKTAKGAEFENAKINPGKNYCRITVSDNGIGFAEEYKEKIFELFQRLNGKAEYSGTGIGLAIVKKIVENHHGLITANSSLDKGATFNIYLPADGEAANK